PLLERVLQSVETPIIINEQQAKVSTSIGATFYPADQGSPQELIKHADEAMYVAKKSGKSRFHFRETVAA
ncbi:MAG: diguanylate cyclase, partial [Mariprofundaceae bacterium]|nr:diguanylate cyclase [Mariprofundaceae bacterium]